MNVDADGNADRINRAETKIDKEFTKSPLMNLPYNQALWTILSVMEDRYLKITVIKPLLAEQQHAYIDTFVNALAHPARALYKKKGISSNRLQQVMIDAHYGWANEWIEQSETYAMFCSIFPLWHNGKITIQLSENNINTGNFISDCDKYKYEAYNRIIRKDGDREETFFETELLIPEVIKFITIKGDRFLLNFNPKLVALLAAEHTRTLGRRYVLPSDWNIGAFNFSEFKKVFTTIQAMLYGWYIARVSVAQSGMPGLAYSSAVWVVSPIELIARVSRYSKLTRAKVSTIFSYLTFGNHNIREPDIAVQPLVALDDQNYALSPFLWINTNAERNICTLLNKIPTARKAYSELTTQKESVLVKEVRDVLEKLGYEVAFGKLNETDIDIAIIDRNNKVCACIELKWFIEPAEIRETIEKSIELKKGVTQSGTILALFKSGDKRLLEGVLKIDGSYRFSSFVGSRNWIGSYDVQDDNVKIIKIWHFIKTLGQLGDLSKTLDWLESGKYLPVYGKDFDIIPVDLKLGPWQGNWYGLSMWINQK